MFFAPVEHADALRIELVGGHNPQLTCGTISACPSNRDEAARRSRLYQVSRFIVHGALRAIRSNSLIWSCANTAVTYSALNSTLSASPKTAMAMRGRNRRRSRSSRPSGLGWAKPGSGSLVAADHVAAISDRPEDVGPCG